MQQQGVSALHDLHHDDVAAALALERRGRVGGGIDPAAERQAFRCGRHGDRFALTDRD